ncbi:MAG: hypothetical protein JWP29_1858, partial [Rhodoferax sp.]|nr:hypothetical protein [Rhodoferax sp.]
MRRSGLNEPAALAMTPLPHTGAESPRSGRRWAIAAIAWLLVVLVVGVHQWQFWRGEKLNTDVLALLPENEQAPEVSLATRQLSDRAARQVVVMVGAPTWPEAQRAAAAWRQALA